MYTKQVVFAAFLVVVYFAGFTYANSYDDCPDSVVVGQPCDYKVDCNHCGNCDWFVHCQRGVWTNTTCDLQAEADGTIRVSKKLFWNKGGNVHGGTCVPWANLKPEHKPSYKEDPNCKPICEFSEHETCIRKYLYVDPKFEDDIWSAPPFVLECPKSTMWDQAKLTCAFCAPGKDCESEC